MLCTAANGILDHKLTVMRCIKSKSIKLTSGNTMKNNFISFDQVSLFNGHEFTCLSFACFDVKVL